MRADFVETFKRAMRAHSEVVAAEAELRRLLTAEPAVASSREELADAAYALREAEAIVDEGRKKLRGLRELAERMCCMVSAVSGDGECVRTPHCTAIPTVRTNVSVPTRKRDYEGWRALMRHLGVPDGLLGGPAESEHAAIDVHWPGLMDLLSREAAEGKPLPPGVDPNKTVAAYSLTIRKKKGVTE